MRSLAVIGPADFVQRHSRPHPRSHRKHFLRVPWWQKFRNRKRRSFLRATVLLMAGGHEWNFEGILVRVEKPGKCIK